MDSKKYPVYYQSYIDRVPEGELIDLFQFSLSEALKTLVMISEDKGNYAYDEGKWTIKQVVQHLIDVERILTYRALCFARGESTDLPGFDHDEYVNQSDPSHRSMKSLLEELKGLRATTINLFASFNEEMLARGGVANGVELKVHQQGFVIIGHLMHHVRVIETRYLG